MEVHPKANIVVLEAASTVGGTWAEHRLYPGLITNNMVGMYHYPGYAQDEATYGVKPGSHIPGRVVHDYLTRFVVGQFFNILTNDVITLNGYDNHPELKKLKPWHSAFYEGGQLSINNYPTNPFDLVREGKIRPHVADITEISTTAVHLSNGERLETDAVICATGWKHKPPIKFLGISDQDLGLPFSSANREQLVEEANATILKRFPSLKTQPSIPHEDVDGLNHPYRQYRFLVPPAYFEKRNIAFVGTEITTITTIAAALQALWVSAFFDNKLDRTPALAEVKWQTMLHSQSLKWRYPMGLGAKHPDFVFDGIPYIDQLMADLGLERWRKKGRIAEMTEPYTADDYADVVDEWKDKHGWTGTV